MPQLINKNFGYEETEHDAVDLTPVVDAIYDIKHVVDNMSIPEPKDSVEITNLDQIKLYLKQELRLALAPILSKIDSIKIPEVNIPDQISVSNFPAQEKIESISVNNLSELKDYLSGLVDAISNVSFPPAQVSVTAPEVIVPPITVPETQVNIDVNGILRALEPLKFISDRPSKPISVRLSDGKKFLKQMVSTIKQTGERLATVVSTAYGLSQDEFRTTLRDSEDPTLKYKPYKWYDSAYPQYFMYVDKSGNWYIHKIAQDGDDYVNTFVTGTGSLATNWTNKAGLTYVPFDEAF